jgi:hypothetical protein
MNISDLSTLYQVGCDTVGRWRKEYAEAIGVPLPRRGHYKPHTDEAKERISIGIKAAILDAANLDCS